MHQVQLTNKTVLKRANEFGQILAPELELPEFFSGIATVGNTWREFSSPVHQTWIGEYGFPAGKCATKRLPPRCLSNRWGSAAKFVKWLLNIDVSQTQHVLKLVLDGHDGDVVLDKTKYLDETALNDTVYFHQKRGRWVRTTLKCVTCAVLVGESSVCVCDPFHLVGHSVLHAINQIRMRIVSGFFVPKRS